MKLQLPKSSGKKVSAETLDDPNGWYITCCKQLHSTEQTNRFAVAVIAEASQKSMKQKKTC